MMTGFVLQAQNDQEAEAKALYEKAIQEKEQQLKQMEMQLKKQQLEQQKKMAELEEEHARQARSSARSSARAANSYRVMGVSTLPELADEPSFLVTGYGQQSQSHLTVRNSFKGESDSADGEFDVDENTSHMRLTINGKVSKGDISIKILYPGGKVFKNLTINSSAQISFSQSLTIKEEEKKKYVGSWKYAIKADKAEGSYNLSIMTH